jgi:hypothetical protein
MQPVAVSELLDLTNRSFPLVLGLISSLQSWSDLLIIVDTQLADQHQLGWFLVDFAPVYLIWLMEANRRANYLKPIQLYVHHKSGKTEFEVSLADKPNQNSCLRPIDADRPLRSVGQCLVFPSLPTGAH